MKSVIASLLCCFIATAYSQEKEKQVIPPSPNAAAFAKYGNIPVSYYTGTTNISVPIYTIQIRDISVPISLDYHTGGIKVSEEASRVGLGWVLSCGGLISRNIVNDDDLAAHPWAYLHPTNNSPQLPSGPRFQKASVLGVGGMLNFFDSETGSPSTIDLTDYIYGAEFDYEPDQFNYNFAGHSGKFVMGRDRVAVIERQEKISLVPSLDGNSWEVKTADGLKYFFEASEYTVDFNDTGAQQKTAWYLTKIISPLGEEVLFEYTELDEQFIRPVGSYQEKAVPVSTSCGNFICKTVTGKAGPLPRKIYSNIALSRVTWKLGKVEFVFGNRDDIDGDIRVDAINVFARQSNDFRLLTSYRLEHDYFNYQVAGSVFPMPDVDEGNLTKRLKLIAVRKFPGDDSLPAEWAYSFKYHENSRQERLPSKNSYARDHWGYYNGRQNTSLIPDHQQFSSSASPSDIIGVVGDNRDPSPLHAMAFALREVTYPTGGTTSLYYEANDFDFKDQTPNTSAFPRWHQVLYDCHANAGQMQSTPLDLTKQYISSVGVTIPVEISAAFRSNQRCDQVANVTGIYFEIIDESGTLISRVSLGLPPCNNPDQRDCIFCDPENLASGILSFKGMMTIPRGRYYVRAFAPQGEDRFENISVSIKSWMDSRLQSPIAEGSRIALAGGLRIARIADHDPVTGQTTTRTFTYNFLDDRNSDGQPELHSYGKRMAVPRYSYFDIFWEKRDFPGVGSETCIQCVNLIRQSDSFVPATGSQGYSVGYDRVIEKRGTSGGNGWTEYEFHNDSDIPIEIKFPNVAGEFPIRAPSVPTISFPLNGLLKSVTQYRSDSIPVSKILKHYQTRFNKTVYGVEYRRTQAINFSLLDFMNVYQSLGVNSDLITLTYPSLQSSLIVSAATTEIHFDSLGNQTLVKTTHSFHDNPNHLQPTRSTTTTSEGRVLTTSYKYAADYDDVQSDEAISWMKGDAHNHETPIEVAVTDETDPQNLKVVSKSLTVFNLANGRILPGETVVLDNNEPLSVADIPDYSPASGYDSLRYRSEVAIGYSATGNLQRITKHNDIDISYLWGYDDSLPIAEVTNAANSLFEYTQAINSQGNIGVTIAGTAPHTFTFHVDYQGTVYLKLGVPGSTPSTTVAAYSGIEAGFVTLGTGACSTTVIPFFNVMPGTHQITISLTTTAESAGVCGEIIYPKRMEMHGTTGFTEFFYESFENQSGVPDGLSHTGNRCRPGDYLINFNPPTQRPYKIEYWYLAGDDWKYHTEPYVGPTMDLTTGTAIDDVRIYPVDAQMKTYTYEPGIGMTSAILESGATIIYEYDPYGRLAAIRDGQRNIERAFEYSYLNR